MNEVFIVESQTTALVTESGEWWPLYMHYSLEDAQRNCDKMNHRWPKGYRVIRYTATNEVFCPKCSTCGNVFAPGVDPKDCDHKPRRPDGSLRSSRA
jgi:hypothetical protein